MKVSETREQNLVEQAREYCRERNFAGIWPDDIVPLWMASFALDRLSKQRTEIADDLARVIKMGDPDSALYGHISHLIDKLRQENSDEHSD